MPAQRRQQRRNGYAWSLPLDVTVNFLSAKAYHAKARFLEDSFSLLTVVWEIICQVLSLQLHCVCLWGLRFSLGVSSAPHVHFLLLRSFCHGPSLCFTLSMSNCLNFLVFLTDTCLDHVFLLSFLMLLFFFFFLRHFNRKALISTVLCWKCYSCALPTLLCVKIASGIYVRGVGQPFLCYHLSPGKQDIGFSIWTHTCCLGQNHSSVHVLKQFAIWLQVIQL